MRGSQQTRLILPSFVIKNALDAVVICSGAMRAALSSVPRFNIPGCVFTVPDDEVDRVSRLWFDVWSEDLGNKL